MLQQFVSALMDWPFWAYFDFDECRLVRCDTLIPRDTVLTSPLNAADSARINSFE
jgi:hypothetical protein